MTSISEPTTSTNAPTDSTSTPSKCDGGAQAGVRSGMASTAGKSALPLDALEGILERLRLSLKKRGAEGIRGLSKHFRLCDKDRSGKLNHDEFQKVVHLNKLGLEKDEAALVFEVFDQDRSGEISYEEFLRFARATDDSEEGELNVRDVIAKLHRVLRKAAAQGIDTAASFKHFDKDGNGVIDKAEFKEAIEELGFSATAAEFGKLFEHFEREGVAAKRQPIVL